MTKKIYIVEVKVLVCLFFNSLWIPPKYTKTTNTRTNGKKNIPNRTSIYNNIDVLPIYTYSYTYK